tara:strand:+ start:180 stop:809 length:630 start_codon:yes stop_codon:yes gene_type:complete
MKVKELLTGIAILLLISFQLVTPMSSAHTGGVFTIIVSENGVVPGNVQMLVNDTARWINVDKRENVTHRILVDADSDGNYSNNNDWDSGNLTHYCEHVNGTKVDENCNAYFDVIFNETALNMSYYDIVGKYAFVDLIFNETSGETKRVYGNVTVNPDSHLTAGFQDTTESVTEEVEEDGTSPLLLIAGGSALGAIALGVMIVLGKKDEE